MPPELSPLHRDLDYLTPLAPERAAELQTFLTDAANGTVLDIGCGWSRFLIQLLESSPDLRGVGMDADAASIAHGRDTAIERGVADRIELQVGDALELMPGNADAVICIGASHIWGPHTEELHPIDYGTALRAIRGLLEVGAPAVYGEAIWSQNPSPSAVAALGGMADEFVRLPELLEIVADAGFVPVRTHEASLDEWDRFESGFMAGYARWLAEHPSDHPDAQEVNDKLTGHRDRYFNGYRATMGMAYLQLLAV
jgi:SAM-dependent methyltransferase